jgi:hypothetical protein
VPFIGAKGERDGRTMEGNGRRRWSAMMVVEAAVLGGDRPGTNGGGVVLGPFWKRKGRREAARAHTRYQWRRRPVGSGRKTTGRGGLAGPAKG